MKMFEINLIITLQNNIICQTKLPQVKVILLSEKYFEINEEENFLQSWHNRSDGTKDRNQQIQMKACIIFKKY